MKGGKMKYEVEVAGGFIELPRYSFDIDEKLSELSALPDQLSYRDKIGMLYDFEAALFESAGVDIEDILGAPAEADPNEVHITFLRIADAYLLPGRLYEAEKLSKSPEIAAVRELGEIVKQAEALQKAATVKRASSATNRQAFARIC